jgi:predicted permease
VRLSIGAGRLRLLRQLITESMMLACAGGIAGLAIGSVTLALLVRWIPPDIGIAGLQARLDSHMLLFTMATALLTGLLFGLAPAVRLVRSDVQTPLKNQGTTVSSAAGSVRLRKGLLVSQVTLTTVLLAGAGLFTRSLINVTHARLGVRTDHLVQFAVSPELNRYTPQQTAAFAAQLTRQLGAVPGVRSVSAAEVGVFMNSTNTSQITPEGYRVAEDENLLVGRNWIGPGYFSTMGIPLIAGREFTESDSLETPKVVIINEKLARRYFNGRDPIGQHLTFQTGNKARPDIEIVGVVQNSKHDDARDEIRAFVYSPYLQDKTLGQLIFYVRSEQSPAAVYPAVQKTVAAIDAGLPLYSMMTVDEQLGESMFADSFVAFLSLCMAVIAALLAAIGLYGVMAYVVARRTREIGVRIALGATRGNIIWLVLREAVRMTAIGLTLGLVLSVLGGKSAGSFLFGVKATEPLVLIVAALLLSAVAALAGGLPARRAASVDPVVALRYE